MDDVESYLNRVCRHIAGSRALRAHLREELREHLEEAIERHRDEGLAEDEATRRAIEEFGTPETVGAGLVGVYGQRFTGVLIDRAIEWKERTMKTGWKWRFVAHAAMLATIVVSVLFVLFAEIYILPRAVHTYSELELALPDFALHTWSVSLVLTQYWYAWLVPLCIAALLFEWRFRGEHRGNVRMAFGGVGAFVSITAALLVAATLVVAFALLPVTVPTERLAPIVATRVGEANTALAALREATSREDWPAAVDANDRLHEALDYLSDHSGSTVPLLAVWSRREEVRDIRRLLEDAVETSRGVGRHDAVSIEELRARLARVDAAYAGLTARLAGRDGASQPGSD